VYILYIILSVTTFLYATNSVNLMSSPRARCLNNYCLVKNHCFTRRRFV
jgi:hypothetical protein